MINNKWVNAAFKQMIIRFFNRNDIMVFVKSKVKGTVILNAIEKNPNPPFLKRYRPTFYIPLFNILDGTTLQRTVQRTRTSQLCG